MRFPILNTDTNAFLKHGDDVDWIQHPILESIQWESKKEATVTLSVLLQFAPIMEKLQDGDVIDLTHSPCGIRDYHGENVIIRLSDIRSIKRSIPGVIGWLQDDEQVMYNVEFKCAIEFLGELDGGAP